MTTIVTLFWLSAFLILYTYAVYPLLVWLRGFLRSRPSQKRRIYPNVTVVIPAHNEAAVIAPTILNKLDCEYPPEKREVLVISDSSDDGTDEIVASIPDAAVRLIRQEPRQGKTAALNRAIQAARGEIIVFSDANSIYSRDALQQLVSNFADPGVGYVTGRMGYLNPDGSGVADGCSAYMEYENALRSLESRCGSIVGTDGGIDAVRKDLYVPMPPDILPDFVLPLSVVQRGFRVVYEPKAVVEEDALGSSQGEFRMRVRVILRSLHAMWYMRHMFNPFKYGLFSFQLLSHKLLRYSVPFLLISLAVFNALLIGHAKLWAMLFLAQCVFYVTAILGYLLLRVRRRLPSVTFLPLYFVLLNGAALVAWLKFFSRKKQTVWVPRTG